MFILLFVLWIIFNGKVTLEITLFGLVICAALYLFLYKFMNYSVKRELLVIKCLGRFAKYVCYLVVEIIKANLAVAGLILKFDHEPEPVLVRFHTKLKTQTGQTILANSITLTPGTITANLEDGEYLVHSLDREYAVGIHESGFVGKISKMEELVEREVAGNVL